MSNKAGYLFVIAAALLWAASGTASKFLFANGITPLELVQIRAAGSAVFLATWLAMRNASLLKIARRDFAYFILLGALLAVTQFTYLFAINTTLVAVAILLQYQAPVIVALYMLTVLRERLARTTIVAIVCSITGCYLAVGAYNVDMISMNRVGIISGVCSAVTFALYTVKSEQGLRRYPPWTVLLYAFLVAAIIWNVVYPPFHAFTREHPLLTWWWIFFVTLFGTILPFGCYNLGIQRIRPAHASVTATLEPIVAAIISFMFLGEVLELWQIIGGVLVVISIVILQRKSPEGKIVPFV
jgi:drug/metabolite transporter (DMT)-like permease